MAERFSISKQAIYKNIKNELLVLDEFKLIDLGNHINKKWADKRDPNKEVFISEKEYEGYIKQFGRHVRQTVFAKIAGVTSSAIYSAIKKDVLVMDTDKRMDLEDSVNKKWLNKKAY